jgi:hypothetical protein
MVWVIIGIAMLIMMAAVPAFRKFGAVIVLVAVFGLFSIWFYQKYGEEQSRKRISPSELIFEDVSLNPSYIGYDLAGRIINNSKKYTLKGIQVKLTLRDCAKDNESNCVVIAEHNEYIQLSIPPEQKRDFKDGFYLNPEPKVRGKLNWDYKIEYLNAE